MEDSIPQWFTEEHVRKVMDAFGEWKAYIYDEILDLDVILGFTDPKTIDVTKYQDSVTPEIQALVDKFNDNQILIMSGRDEANLMWYKKS